MRHSQERPALPYSRASAVNSLKVTIHFLDPSGVILTHPFATRKGALHGIPAKTKRRDTFDSNRPTLQRPQKAATCPAWCLPAPPKGPGTGSRRRHPAPTRQMTGLIGPRPLEREQKQIKSRGSKGISMPHNNTNQPAARPDVLTRPKLEGGKRFVLASPFEPAGDQPRAIAELTSGINAGDRDQVLLGATGTGKTFTMAKIIEQTQRPAIILAPNKTLAAQLYGEFKGFFPENAVEYFVSYYDYYQPEAYVARSDTFIEKESQINEQIDRMRHSATRCAAMLWRCGPPTSKTAPGAFPSLVKSWRRLSSLTR